jgi:hypothetical protein
LPSEQHFADNKFYGGDPVMTAFTEFDQWENDYELYVIDNRERIGRLCHFGWRLLPPSIAKSKENWEKVADYFLNLPIAKVDYSVCPDLNKHLDHENLLDYDEYVKFFGEISSKGIYTYDSYNLGFKERPYFRVTIPNVELTLDDLPEEIKNILEELMLYEISFAETSLIPEELVSKL